MQTDWQLDYCWFIAGAKRLHMCTSIDWRQLMLPAGTPSFARLSTRQGLQHRACNEIEKQVYTCMRGLAATKAVVCRGRETSYLPQLIIDSVRPIASDRCCYTAGDPTACRLSSSSTILIPPPYGGMLAHSSTVVKLFAAWQLHQLQRLRGAELLIGADAECRYVMDALDFVACTVNIRLTASGRWGEFNSMTSLPFARFSLCYNFISNDSARDGDTCQVEVTWFDSAHHRCENIDSCPLFVQCLLYRTLSSHVTIHSATFHQINIDD